MNLQNGCNFHAQDRLGNTALMYAAMKGRDELMNFMVDTLAKVSNALFIKEINFKKFQVFEYFTKND